MTEVTSGTQPDASMADTSVADTSMADVLITVDHVYLPFDETGKNVRTDWAVTSVSTTSMPSQPAASISCAVRAAPRADATVVVHSCMRPSPLSRSAR